MPLGLVVTLVLLGFERLFWVRGVGLQVLQGLQALQGCTESFLYSVRIYRVCRAYRIEALPKHGALNELMALAFKPA